MAELDDETLRLASPILERYRKELFKTRGFPTRSLEHELRDVWSAGYRTIKDFILAMSEHGRFQEVAAYYMEHSGAPGVVSEFKRRLAELYGVKSYDHSPDREVKREQFWARAFGESTT